MEPRKPLHLWLKLSSEDGVKRPKEKVSGEACLHGERLASSPWP